MKKFKPLSIYPDPQLRNRLELIAENSGRSINKQVVRFLRHSVARADRMRQQRRKAQSSCGTGNGERNATDDYGKAGRFDQRAFAGGAQAENR